MSLHACAQHVHRSGQAHSSVQTALRVHLTLCQLLRVGSSAFPCWLECPRVQSVSTRLANNPKKSLPNFCPFSGSVINSITIFYKHVIKNIFYWQPKRKRWSSSPVAKAESGHLDTFPGFVSLDVVTDLHKSDIDKSHSLLCGKGPACYPGRVGPLWVCIVWTNTHIDVHVHTEIQTFTQGMSPEMQNSCH